MKDTEIDKVEVEYLIRKKNKLVNEIKRLRRILVLGGYTELEIDILLSEGKRKKNEKIDK